MIKHKLHRYAVNRYFNFHLVQFSRSQAVAVVTVSGGSSSSNLYIFALLVVFDGAIAASLHSTLVKHTGVDQFSTVLLPACSQNALCNDCTYYTKSILRAYAVQTKLRTHTTCNPPIYVLDLHCATCRH
jgi:hypothetical protein